MSARARAARRILIVEDDALNLKLLEDLMQSQGYDTIAVGDGESALAHAAESAPDLILLDIILPDRTGFEIARAIKDDPRSRAIPIIAVTAMAMAGDEARLREAGLDDYVAKPISVAGLLQTVARHLA